jgi:hypothetical protein
VPKMRTWIKAIGIACVIELLCVIPLAVAIAHGQPGTGRLVNVFLNLLGLYHILAMTLAFTVLNITSGLGTDQWASQSLRQTRCSTFLYMYFRLSSQLRSFMAP